jgi:hypothetical protein
MDREALKNYLKSLTVAHDHVCYLVPKEFGFDHMPSIKKNMLNKLLTCFKPVYDELDECLKQHEVSSWGQYLLVSKAIQPFIAMFTNKDIEVKNRDDIFGTEEFDTTPYKEEFVRKSGLPRFLRVEITDLFGAFLESLVIGSHDKKAGFCNENIESYMLTLNILCEGKGLPLFRWGRCG